MVQLAEDLHGGPLLGVLLAAPLPDEGAAVHLHGHGEDGVGRRAGLVHQVVRLLPADLVQELQEEDENVSEEIHVHKYNGP